MKIYSFSEIKTDSSTNKNKTNKTEIYKKYFTENIPPSNVHVLRSVSQWSAGVKKTENSILNAYYDLIKKAKHYIYIENQFFVSKSWNKEERENLASYFTALDTQITLQTQRLEKLKQIKSACLDNMFV